MPTRVSFVRSLIHTHIHTAREYTPESIVIVVACESQNECSKCSALVRCVGGEFLKACICAWQAKFVIFILSSLFVSSRFDFSVFHSFFLLYFCFDMLFYTVWLWKKAHFLFRHVIQLTFKNKHIRQLFILVALNLTEWDNDRRHT